MGGKTGGSITETTLAHKRSPISLDYKAGTYEANASIEQYSAGAGIQANAVKAGVTLEPFNWFGYEPLKEWFGWEYSPYIGIEASLGGGGVKAQIGMNSELYVGDGIGVGLKLGAKKD